MRRALALLRISAGAKFPWRPGNKVQAGFTLIEVVVAVVILALAYASILQNFSLSLRNIYRVDSKQTELFSRQLEFETLLAKIGAGEEKDQQGEVFLEGNRSQVVMLTDESGQLVTLLVEPIK